MLIYGTGGHAKVIIDCCRALDIPITAVIDDGPKVEDPFYAHAVSRVYKEELHTNPLVIAIGNNHIRKKIAQKIKPLFGKVVHPSAMVQENVQIGEGSVVFHGCIIQVDTKIGNHVIVNTAASIDHDCVLEDYVHIAPHATLCGGITIGEGTLIGAGATIIPNVKIGKWCTIGAGAVVNKDLDDNSKAVGNPVRLIGK